MNDASAKRPKPPPQPLPPSRRQTRPRSGDTLETLARRELPDLDADEALSRLREWNPHLNAFRVIARPLLVSDIVYLEPPPQR